MSSHNNDGSSNGGSGGSGGAQPEKAPSTTPLTADSPTKRVALAGQWRTPPLPVFGAGGTGGMKMEHQQQQQAHRTSEQAGEAQLASYMPAAQGSQPHSQNDFPEDGHSKTQASQLPGSAEDYAKALQEAYLRGAQAAAAMAAAQGPTLPQAASMPNLQVQPTSMKKEYIPVGVAAVEASSEVDLVTPILPPPQSSSPNHRSVPNPLELMDPDSMSNNHHNNHNNHNHNNEEEMDDNGKIMPPPSQPHQHPRQVPSQNQHPGGQQNLNQSQNATTSSQSTHQQRSISLPDMTTYAAAQEAEKRAKRLARNRASARLRRLRKKNLVRTVTIVVHVNIGVLVETTGVYLSFPQGYHHSVV
jgi:hypothetical protein